MFRPVLASVSLEDFHLVGSPEPIIYLDQEHYDNLPSLKWVYVEDFEWYLVPGTISQWFVGG